MKKLICMFVATVVLAAGASAQTYPARPIRFITVAAPGTVGDIVPRVVGQEFATRLKQPVVVENRPGGSGLVGATAGAHSAPDGYNLLLSTSGTMIVNTFVYSKMPFDSQKDFEPVARRAALGPGRRCAIPVSGSKIRLPDLVPSLAMTLAATSLKLPQRLKSRVERLTRRSKESPHAFMIRAIEDQVQAEELHSRFLADAARADETMQRTGLGYAAADVHAYLEAKAAGRTARKPKPVKWRR